MTIYTCPKCKALLTFTPSGAVCPSRHSYDRAREGYVNLLLGASAGTHGDNKEMILARRDFLDTGIYAPLRDAVVSAVLSVFPRDGVLLDGGAGECYYTSAAEEALTAAGLCPKVFAFDISKDAVRLASKRNGKIALAVAGVYDMPVETASADVYLCMFAPFCREEILRVLRPGGYLCLAIPDRDHLYGLKEILYDHPYYNEVSDPAIEGFTLLSDTPVSRQVTLTDPAAIRALFSMTPYAYRTGEAGVCRLLSRSEVTTPVSFRVFLYRKEENA